MRRFEVLLAALLLFGGLTASACQDDDCCREGQQCQGNICREGLLYECDYDELVFSGRVGHCENICEVFYGDDLVYERHRHRYEFNNEYRQAMENEGFIFSGTSPDGRLVEIIELKDHPWFLASQFHPEFTSRPTRPQPLVRDFIEASIKTNN